MHTTKVIPDYLNPRQIRSYINFDGRDEISLEGSSQSCLQSEGVAALWHLLNTKGYAYLADEVGMGKTRQAMGVIATQFLSDPNSHVVIVCPRRTLQNQWASEWDAFIRTCYKPFDNRLKNALDGKAVQVLDLHERLRDFAASLLLNENRIHLLRYSSFSRPIWFGESKKAKTTDDIFEVYKDCLRQIGIAGPSEDENNIFTKYQDQKKTEWRQEMTSDLNEAYSIRVGRLLKARDIDLVIFDEAQYLRHLGNRQNINIRHVFQAHVKKWLFLSATPLHTGPDDIQSLDAYLCSEKGNYQDKCPNCTNRCTRVSYRRKHEKKDVVDLLKDFLVRRPRTYQNYDKTIKYSKTQYRKYEKLKITASSDPFLSLTMAIVQKHLVNALSGGNNRFRQGECSSFESLSSSIKRIYKNHDGNKCEEKEFEKSALRSDDEKQQESPDRSFIDNLNDSFQKSMFSSKEPGEMKGAEYCLPHAKLNDAADKLFRENLRHAINHKTLVFVRRLDTVDELTALILSLFQKEVDKRLESWRQFFLANQENMECKPLWDKDNFWANSPADSLEDEEDYPNEDIDVHILDDGSILERAGKLDYFESLKRYKDKNKKNGMLTSFQSSLLNYRVLSKNPLRGFLLTKKDASSDNDDWEKAEEYWKRFAFFILGKDYSGNAAAYAWLFSGKHDDWKLATLKRCLLQSMRQTDFLVDLFVLHRFFKTVIPEGDEKSLPDKLLWFLGENRREELSSDLETYVNNWKEKFYLWFYHFDLIVDKCLRGDDAGNWQDIYNKMDGTFARMSPVMGRSGRLQEQNTVPQFKFPTHPNVLVCTDVLKEGVDLHLFCDKICHYGVAWTSGDLEQRIGRIDRFGSQISRMIEQFSPNNSAAPRLQVEFPFLDGTLDKYQVERVIREKIKSDYRMDLGKREEDMGFISIDDIGISDSSSPNETQLVIGNNHDFRFYPNDVPGDPEPNSSVNEISINMEISEKLTKLKDRIKSIFNGDINYIPTIQALVTRRTATSLIHANILRASIKKESRKEIIIKELEYIINEMTPPETIVEPFLPGDNLLGTDCNNTPGKDFIFSNQWNTLFREIIIDNPFAEENEKIRKQTVLLEQIGTFWLLRTPVFVENRDIYHGENGNWEYWIAKQNRDRKWGYFLKEQGIIWFVVLAFAGEKKASNKFLGNLVERIGKAGDRFQHLYYASDDPDNWGYKSSMSFPIFPALRKDLCELLSNKDELIMKANQEDVKNYGLLISEIQSWFQDSFKQILNAIYNDENPDKRGLTILPVVLLDKGILHLRTEGAERFCLQAFLQLDDMDGHTGVFSAPRIIWELVASSNSMGPKPTLKLTEWNNLPHNDLDNETDWQNYTDEQNKSYSLYFWRDERDRSMVIYHSPSAFDISRNSILNAWKKILAKLQGTNFMKEECRKIFTEALQTIDQQ
ncbi:MAG: hypothetical protein CVU71_07190 [Deltaproteobacteria bacterium HGW-Deltaproteobacteria-6]|jgi:superfamily II DNA or RNA helicase|nr:MAG: hypothetical protein CVU71_07190 [Deltaproteobacteria bacterium HGW-Deltaproteobacteria-6]